MATILQAEFSCIFLNENIKISIQFSLKLAINSPIDNSPALVQIMAVHLQAVIWTSDGLTGVYMRHAPTKSHQWFMWHYRNMTSTDSVVNKMKNSVSTLLYGCLNMHCMCMRCFAMFIRENPIKNLHTIYSDHKHYINVISHHITPVCLDPMFNHVDSYSICHKYRVALLRFDFCYCFYKYGLFIHVLQGYLTSTDSVV